MHVVALMSQKGGAGKSTLAVHLATEATSRGQKTLLLDLDPQGNLTGWAERRGDAAPDVEAIHASNLSATLKSARGEGYDLVLIDTAPNADRTTMQVAQAADLVVSPCQPAQFDLDALTATLDLCLALKRPVVVVINAAPPRENSSVVADAISVVKEAGVEVSSAIISFRVAFRHCLASGNTAAEYEPGGKAAQEISKLYDDMSARLHVDMPTRGIA
ncbi:ParA family protein [Pseudoroseomonas ludipueritiae]|uniref:ParA family protein n=1 Tax=Pseudoroseomonas ludipueritiae TaxID=198093 RepID=A0ABR7R354_9PROT|nr:ParA family protein [Pseudoroseomonas ludipueritiae]MBC9176155.1 ParA family protein [Pseudoroseomonas ludipueritiae]